MLAATGLLNKINVYPVPDGDTGTNLSMTLTAVDHALARLGTRSAGEVLAAAADAAVDGARGNSGAIMAEFLQGLADSVSDRRRINAAELAFAFASADRYARGALDAPQEGTILTAITAVAGSLTRETRSHAKDLRAILPAAVEVARQRGGADARDAARDAQGRRRGRRRQGLPAADGRRGRRRARQAGGGDRRHRGHRRWPPKARLPMATDSGEHDADIEFRYCTECIVTGTGIDRRKLRDELAALGNSLVIAGSRDKVKIHIHVDAPNAVFEIAGRYGTVGSQKADDMTRQAQARAQRDRPDRRS